MTATATSQAGDNESNLIRSARSVTARKDSDHTPHRIPKHISRSETCGTRRSNVGNGEAPFSGNGN